MGDLLRFAIILLVLAVIAVFMARNGCEPLQPMGAKIEAGAKKAYREVRSGRALERVDEWSDTSTKTAGNPTN